MRPPVVLVVDDMQDNRDMYMEYLRYVGYRVLGAADGQTAIQVARAARPSVILMDLSLPGIDGWEATSILKDDPCTSDIPIIAITGHASERCRARALRMGCTLFVTKPSLPAEVAEHIARVLDRALGKASSNE
jgi:two-component system, cell cycle response regulator DivK